MNELARLKKSKQIKNYFKVAGSSDLKRYSDIRESEKQECVESVKGHFRVENRKNGASDPLPDYDFAPSAGKSGPTIVFYNCRL